MLAFVGVPGIYLSSLFGLRNDRAGVAATGRFRSINRAKLDADQLLAVLDDPASLSGRVFRRYRRLLDLRGREAAFHPLGIQTVLELDPRLFALERVSPDGAARLLAIHNVSAESVTVTLPHAGINRLDGRHLHGDLTLAPYQFIWLALT